jgi:uncharacterized protein (TIGR02172 family)
MYQIKGKIDSTNAPEFEKEIMAAKPAEIDAAGLTYISSAGLRVLMKLRKEVGAVTINNVSPEVYEIFDVTGFTSILTVKKALREISIDGCELIGKGATACVYRIDQDTIVKVFNKNVEIGMAIRESEKARNAFVAGIPTAIAFDMVKVGDCYGMVYELLNARTLTHVIAGDKAHLTDYVIRFAREIRKLHQIEVDPAQFQDLRSTSLEKMPLLVGLVGTQEEIDALSEMYKALPERRTFIHGDCHIGNIMLQDDEWLFIDLSTSGMGHPILDLTSMALTFKFTSMKDNYDEKRKTSELNRDFTREEAKLIWDTFLRAYLDTDDEAFLKMAEYQVMAYSALRILFVAFAVPGLISDQELQGLKQFALGYCQHIQPICFD